MEKIKRIYNPIYSNLFGKVRVDQFKQQFFRPKENFSPKQSFQERNNVKLFRTRPSSS